MWQSIGNWFRLLWDAGRLLQDHATAIKESKTESQQLLSLVQMLAVQNQQLRSELGHERDFRQEQIESLRREIADSQEKIELRLRLEVSEKLRQLPRGE